MRKMYKTIIIGGGFSGLILAERLSGVFGGVNVAVIEKNDRVGKKILATGNGRCNFTNATLSASNYHSVSEGDIFAAIKKYGREELLSYFRELGIDGDCEDGRFYPSGMQASAVLDMLRERLNYLGTRIFTGAAVEKLSYSDDGFTACGGDFEIGGEIAVLCCGGKAGKQYGTDGSGYSLAQAFGHTVTKLYPSLVQLKTDTVLIKGLKGVKCRAIVKAYSEGKEVSRFTGDVLFTDYGISGNAVFFVSSYLVGAKDPEVSLEFLPEKKEYEIKEFLSDKFASLPYVTAENALTGVINKQVGRAIIRKTGTTRFDGTAAEKIAASIKDFRLKVNGTLGFDYAQVTRGGIPVSEVDIGTMESLKKSGLYLCGEILDVDGDCGGYNLQWAFSSAMTAYHAIRRKYENR